MASNNGKPLSIWGNGIDPISVTRLERAVHNVAGVLTAWHEWLRGQSSDPRRNIDDECGYPPSGFAIDIDEYQNYFDREAIARRVVECLPMESWQRQPEITEVSDSEEETDFEAAWKELGQQVTPDDQENYYQDSEGSPIWENLKQGDIRSRIGGYGGVFYGLDDGKKLSEPAAPRNGQRLLFLTPLAETQAKVTQWETDQKSPRWGRPVQYLVDFVDPTRQTSSFVPARSATVHWTRMLHIAESGVIHTPAMQPVFNRLYDLRKIYSADGEGYWKQVIAKLFLETNANLGTDVDIPISDLRDMMENLENGLQKWAVLAGMSAKQLYPTVVDPRPHIEVNIEAICIILGIPVRIFKGSERGELASSQDDIAWNDRVKARQRYYLTPKIIAPFINRMIWLGVLPKPRGFSVTWPDITSRSAQEKAQVASQRLGTFATYVGSDVRQLLTPKDFLTREMDYSSDDADAILKNAVDDVSEETTLAHEQAEVGVASQRTAALSQYLQSGLEKLISPFDYLTKVHGYEDDDARAIIAAAEEHIEAREEEPIQEQQMKAGVALQKTSALTQYKQGELETLIVPLDYLTKILGFSDDDARAIVAAAEEHVAESAEAMLGEEEESALPTEFPNLDEDAGEEETELPEVELSDATGLPATTGDNLPGVTDKPIDVYRKAGAKP